MSAIVEGGAGSEEGSKPRWKMPSCQACQACSTRGREQPTASHRQMSQRPTACRVFQPCNRCHASFLPRGMPFLRTDCAVGRLNTSWKREGENKSAGWWHRHYEDARMPSCIFLLKGFLPTTTLSDSTRFAAWAPRHIDFTRRSAAHTPFGDAVDSAGGISAAQRLRPDNLTGVTGRNVTRSSTGSPIK